jgi:hypothetical protein
MASILKVDTIQDQSGNNIINENADTITIGASGDTITIPSGASMTVPNGGLSGQNYPAFEAYGSAEQTGVADNTWTKLTLNTEVFDTNSMYDVATYRFTPTIAGKYNVYGQVGIYSNTNYQLQIPNISIYKNGSNYKYSANNEGNTNYPNERTLNITAVLEMNGSSDYVELYARANVISGTVVFETTTTISIFGAYRIGD